MTDCADLLLDQATMRAAARACGVLSSSTDEQATKDIDITALSALVESAILFDRIYLVETQGNVELIRQWPALAACPIVWLPLDNQLFERIERDTLVTMRSRKLCLDHPGPYGRRHPYAGAPSSVPVRDRPYHDAFVSVPTDSQRCALEDMLKTVEIHLEWVYEHYGARSGESIQLLLMRFLGLDDKYIAQIVHSILDPSLDVATSDRLKELGDLVAGGGHSASYYVWNSLGRLLAGLGWTMQRTEFYLHIGRLFGIPYAPHPIRGRFLQMTVLADQEHTRSGGSYTEIAKKVSAFIVETYKDIHERANELIETRINRETIPIPPFFVYVLQKASTPSNILSVALDVRNSKGAQALRERFRELQIAASEGRLNAIFATIRDLDHLQVSIRRQLGAEPFEINISKLHLVYTDVELPIKSVGLPSWFARSIFEKTYLAFIRDVTTELVRVASLGMLYDKLFGQRTSN